MRQRNVLAVLVAGLVCVFGLTATAEAQHQELAGTLNLVTAPGSTQDHITWAECTLTFKGESHACSISGLELSKGIRHVSGPVYFLKDVANFAGSYKPSEDTGENMGVGMLHMKNDKGVVVILTVAGTVALEVPSGSMTLGLTQ